MTTPPAGRFQAFPLGPTTPPGSPNRHRPCSGWLLENVSVITCARGQRNKPPPGPVGARQISGPGSDLPPMFSCQSSRMQPPEPPAGLPFPSIAVVGPGVEHRRPSGRMFHRRIISAPVLAEVNRFCRERTRALTSQPHRRTVLSASRAARLRPAPGPAGPILVLPEERRPGFVQIRRNV